MIGWRIIAVVPQPGSAHDSAAIADRVAGNVLFLLPAGEEALAGTLAALTGATLLGRVTRIDGDGDALRATRAAYGGRIALELRHESGPCIATMQEPVAADETLTLLSIADPAIETEPLPERQPPLEGARIVVSGGRGLDESGFSALGEIATAVGGALGASLPAIDLGLATVSRQVGQSGKFVTPEIYLAVGISGTLQHLAGISAATRIIAINADPDAPIFGFAEAGVIADAKTLLPFLLSAVEQRN